ESSLLEGHCFEAHCSRLTDQLIEDLVLPSNNLILTDTMSIPSKDGSECLGYSYKYLEFHEFLEFLESSEFIESSKFLEFLELLEFLEFQEFLKFCLEAHCHEAHCLKMN